jgi:hypothetical protein
MSCYALVVGLSALAFAAAPALAQTAPAQGTVQPRHVTHPAPPHKMPTPMATNADHSADDLNAKELASIQHGVPAPTAPGTPTTNP